MHCPVGIDAERVARDMYVLANVFSEGMTRCTDGNRSSTRPGIKPKLDALRNLYEGKKIIVGRDKLDVVKGVLQKVRSRLRICMTNLIVCAAPCIREAPAGLPSMGGQRRYDSSHKPCLDRFAQT